MLYSTDEIWRGNNEERCLTDDLNAIEGDIADLESGKAPNNHTHTGYAPNDHEHTGYSEADHTHTEYAPAVHDHTGYAPDDHTHTPGDIGAAPASHDHDYADPLHSHVLSEISGLEAALAAKAPNSALTAKADLVDGKVPASQLPGYVDDVLEFANLAAFPATGESGKIYVAQDTDKPYRWSGSGYIVIADSVALGETSATAYRGDRGKIAYEHSQNGDVHVTAAQKNAWDSKAPGNHTHEYSKISGAPTIPTALPANGGNADTVDGKHAAEFALADHIHNVTPVTVANANLDDYRTAGIYSFAAGYQPVNRPEGNSNGWLVVIPWNANATVGTIKQFWLRHGTVGTNDHFLYVRTRTADHGWSSWATVYTSKNPPTAAEVGAAPADHNHAAAYMAKALQFTADNGGIEKTIYTSDNTNLLTELNALGMGFHTVYSQAGVAGNPNTTESWRFLLHKASSNIMWVMAYGTSGSIYSNYLNGTSGWRGWRCLYSASPDCLWSGALYMNASHTVTPSKKLSECRNGWILMWSDYDADTGTANINDVVTSVIFKKSIGGTNWGGAAHYFDVPSYMGADSATDTSGEKRVIKRLYVHDDKLVGHNNNSVGERKDVVLRAVYEF